MNLENPTPGSFWFHDQDCNAAVACPADVTWTRSRPSSVFQPVEGGTPMVVTSEPGLRDYTIKTAFASRADLDAYLTVMRSPYVFIQFAGHHADQWVAPQDIAVSSNDRLRTYEVTIPTVGILAPAAVDPESLL